MEFSKSTHNPKTFHSASGYLRSLVKAIERTHSLLHQPCPVIDYDQVHDVKSSLYAAMERSNLEVERLLTARRMLRELLNLVTIQCDATWQDRQDALKVLEDLRSNITV